MKIHIPTPLRQYADKKDVVEVAGSTVGEGLANLTSRHADLRRHLFTDEGKDRKSTRLNSSHIQKSRMPSSA